MRKLLFLVVAAFSFAAAAPLSAALAQDAEQPKAAAPIPEPMKSVTQHRVRTTDGELRYTATAEEIYTRDAQGNPIASFFTITYSLDGVSDKTKRPVTFVFNGGPGSASLWLHFGLVGPKVVDIKDDASDPGAPPYNLKDNPHTILRATDIVFVDPVGTGYSHALGEHKNDEFWGYDQDADSVAEFIRTYITEKGLWNSPKYILGESYGGIRGGLLAPRLQGRYSMNLNGLILVAPALNMMTLPFIVDGNDLQYATHLPALARAAWYHGKVKGDYADFDAFRKDVEAFAEGEYLEALFKGDRLSDAERDVIAERVAAYTGLSKDYVLKSNLRIYAIRFIKELMRDEGKSIGLLDGRFMQDEVNDVGEFPDGDPFGSQTGPIYVALFQDYLRDQLNVDFNQEYIPSNRQANQAWKRPNQDFAFSGYIDVTEGMAQETKNNSDLRVFTLGGYDDLTVSYFAIEYTMHHSGINADQYMAKTYPGGHMMYLYQPSREQVSDDIVNFIENK